MRSILSFLTRIPIRTGDMERAARQQYLFPLVGAFIGFVVYLVGLITLSCFPFEIVTILTLLALYGIIGLIHLDGLADFSDGVMAFGDRKKKVAVMKDPKVGIAGIFSVLFILLLTFFSLKSIIETGTNKILFGFTIPLYPLAVACIVSEVSAKLGMNTCIFLGRKVHDGLAAIFIERLTATKFAVAFLSAVVISLLITGLFFFVVLVGVFVGMVTVAIANKNFGGVTGDVIGASNELARTATLLVWIAILWLR